MKSHCQPTPIMAGETKFCWTSRFSHASSINSKIFFAKTCGYLLRANNRSMYGIQKYVFGSVPRAVASALHVPARSLPLAVLIQRAFPYTQSQTALMFSHTRQVRLNFTIALLARPEIERDGGQFIDERDKSRVFCQVNGFEVAPASVTGFDSHAWDLLCGVVGEFVRINLEAGRTRDALKGPDVAAIAAHQESTPSFHAAFSQAGRGNIGGEKCDLWIAPAKWAQAVGMPPVKRGLPRGGD